MDRRSFLAAVSVLLAGPARGASVSNFHAIYDDLALRDRFFLFLQNIFHLYPEADFHQLIIDQVAAHPDDRAIYEGVLAGLPGIRPFGSKLTYAVPALQRQKQEMARQSAMLLGTPRSIDGYVEIGTTGRYVASLRSSLPISGRLVIVNDDSPTYSPVDLLERGRVRPVGEFSPLANYAPLDPELIPDASVDLVSSFIGFHHCPADRLPAFVASIRRVLRPGGHLVVREHDVDDPTMDTFVALAHDVFNAGVELSWTVNAAQIRGFRSVAEWTRILEAAGFRREANTAVQAHDPTDNTLLVFGIA